MTKLIQFLAKLFDSQGKKPWPEREAQIGEMADPEWSEWENHEMVLDENGKPKVISSPNSEYEVTASENDYGGTRLTFRRRRPPAPSSDDIP